MAETFYKRIERENNEARKELESIVVEGSTMTYTDPYLGSTRDYIVLSTEEDWVVLSFEGRTYCKARWRDLKKRMTL